MVQQVMKDSIAAPRRIHLQMLLKEEKKTEDKSEENNGDKEKTTLVPISASPLLQPYNDSYRIVLILYISESRDSHSRTSKSSDEYLTRI